MDAATLYMVVQMASGDPRTALKVPLRAGQSCEQAKLETNSSMLTHKEFDRLPTTAAAVVVYAFGMSIAAITLVVIAAGAKLGSLFFAPGTPRRPVLASAW